MRDSDDLEDQDIKYIHHLRFRLNNELLHDSIEGDHLIARKRHYEHRQDFIQAYPDMYYVDRMEDMLKYTSSRREQSTPAALDPRGKVYIGTSKHAGNQGVLDSYGITHILNCTPEVAIRIPGGGTMWRRKCPEMRIENYMEVCGASEDGCSLRSLIYPVVKWITQATYRGRVLIVGAPSNRCSAFCLGYLIGGAKMRLLEAARVLQGTYTGGIRGIYILKDLVKYAKEEGKLDPAPSQNQLRSYRPKGGTYLPKDFYER